MPSKVYVDLDGVLAAFEKACTEFFGKMPSDVGPKEWARLMRDWPTFWIDLEHEKYALDLWKLIGRHANILSARPNGWPAAETGKRIWCRKMLPKFGYNPEQECIICLRADKPKYAKQADGTPNILIDDHEGNIAAWKAAGGIGIYYIPSQSALQRVQDALNKYVRTS